VQGLDGGPLGFLAWGIPQIIGSLAYDAVAQRRPGRAFLPLIGWSVVLMLLGYGLSLPTTLYDRTNFPDPAPSHSNVAESPVLPPGQAWTTKDLRGLLAEPPFVMPPPAEKRPLNYWMMSKRATTLPFIAFSSGFSLSVYAFFVLLADVAGWQIGLFRTFGQNALAVYVVHEVVDKAIKIYAPKDSPFWWVILSFAMFFGITYLFVRSLEKQRIYLRM
jgi:hypothetical protein